MATNALGFTPEEMILRKHDDRGGELRSLYISLIPLSTIFLLLRFTSRRIAKSRLWWDDWLCATALLFSIGLNVVLLLAVEHGGLGKHVEIAGKPAIIYGLKILYASEILYQLAMTLIKISILLFYYRLFNVNHHFTTAIWVIATVTLCWYFASTFVIVFQCKPITYLWDRSIPGGQCVPPVSLWIGSSVTSLLTDVAVLCLPMPMIWRMRATRNQRIALTGMFLLGIFVCITSIVRLSAIRHLSLTDPSWAYVPAAIWTPVECSIAVISACLPTLKPLFRTIFDLTDNLPFDHPSHTKGSRENSSSDGGNGSINGSFRGGEDVHAKQWRAHANAMRICELGEMKKDEDCNQEEKRYGRNFSRPWMGMTLKGKSSRDTDFTAARGAVTEKSSYDTIVAKDARMHKPSRSSIGGTKWGSDGSGSETWDASPRSRATVPAEPSLGRQAGLPIGVRDVRASKKGESEMEIREDSPHLWGRDGMRHMKLPHFAFEYGKTNSVISMPSPTRLV